MNENNTINLNTERKPGGLYRNIKMSVKTADKLILVGIIVLIACMIFAVSHAGFTVTFNTDGGSQIDNQKVMYGQLVDVEENPVKEGYTFTGWNTEKDGMGRAYKANGVPVTDWSDGDMVDLYALFGLGKEIKEKVIFILQLTNQA